MDSAFPYVVALALLVKSNFIALYDRLNSKERTVRCWEAEKSEPPPAETKKGSQKSNFYSFLFKFVLKFSFKIDGTLVKMTNFSWNLIFKFFLFSKNAQNQRLSTNIWLLSQIKTASATYSLANIKKSLPLDSIYHKIKLFFTSNASETPTLLHRKMQYEPRYCVHKLNQNFLRFHHVREWFLEYKIKV